MTFEEILNFSPYSMDMEEKERFLTDRLSELTVHIHDYYGIVEQTGCIYMECERGHLHASIFSDVIARRPIDFSECDMGETGIIQVVSTIPESYPRHSLLTEDEGVILGVDDCPCGRKGKYFKIKGGLMGEHGCRVVALSVPSVVGPSGVQQRIREKWVPEEYRAFFDTVEMIRQELQCV